ncbi:MAG: hypothetical protein D6689_20385 [Deltaproteobacteria bacterium]|nr:MAG: hypothetical protein D6689_20385 [Deltaproteobacteria bacterium]
MSRRLAAACALAAAVVALAVAVSRTLFEDAPVVPADAAPARAAAAPPRPPDAAPAGGVAWVVDVTGVVERATSGGRWTPVAAGDTLSVDDVLRTGTLGRVTIAVGDAEVRLDPDTVFAVSALTDAVTRVQLGEGRIAATVRDGGRRFGVAVRGSDAVAETAAGAFSVLSAGHGDATVAATRGEVTLSANRRTVTVRAGQQSVVAPGSAPTAPAPIPPSLFLKVKAPGRVARSREVTLRGRTAPGAVIRINGERVAVDPSGAFEHSVALREGRNRVDVETRDATGRARTSQVDVEVDTTGPAVGGDVVWGAP